MLVHQHWIGGQLEVVAYLANDKTLLWAIAAPSASTPDKPVAVWMRRYGARLVCVVAVSAKVQYVMLRAVTQACNELGHCSEVVCGVVRKYHKVLCVRGGRAISE